MIAEAPSDLEMLRVRVRRQERLIAEMRQRIRDLEAVLSPEVEIPGVWGLAAKEIDVFRVLLGRDLVTKEQLHTALYADLNDPPAMISIQSHMSKMRSKLRRFGVEITSKRNEGYRLEARLSWRAKLGVPDTTASPQPESLTA